MKRFAWIVAASLLFGMQAAHAADAANGKAKAAGTCATCHGSDGIAKWPNAPHLAGQPEQYLADQIKAYRDGTRVSEVMNVVVKPLTDQEIEDIAAWYSSIEITATPR